MIKNRKIFKTIICSLLTATIIMSQPMSVKAWRGDDHKAIVKDTVSNNNLKNMSQTELNLLYECSKLPDDDYFRVLNSKEPSNTVSALHGRQNYVMALKYLYEISFEYLKNTSAESYIGETIDKYYKEQTHFSNYDRKHIEKINESLKRLLNYNVLKNTSSTYEKSNRKKAIKVMGFTCHLVGDIFAHVAIVPDTHNFTQSMFTSTSKFSAKTKFEKFNKIIDKYEIPFADLAKLTTYKEVLRSNHTESRYLVDDPEFSKDLLESISEDFSKTRDYEDNLNFYKSRRNGTNAITSNILVKFNSALAARDAGKSYSKSFDINTLDAYKNKLRSYNNYKQAAIAK